MAWVQLWPHLRLLDDYRTYFMPSPWYTLHISNLGGFLQATLDIEVLDNLGILATDWRLAVNVFGPPLEKVVLNAIRRDILASYKMKSQQQEPQKLLR